MPPDALPPGPDSRPAATPVLQVDGVGKRYCRELRRSMLYAALDVAADFAFWRSTGARPLRKAEFWALRHVSFTLLPGESLGLIGHNGAGKTTLLKLIAGVLKPDEGQVVVRGRTGALFVQGPGFHPLLTGRQNLFVAGSILGYRDREIREREEEIIRFAAIGPAIDSPVFTYSSGMVARLGFALASHLEPDLLLIDEVLAVGDAAFQVRCLERIHHLRERGTAIVVVSHNPYQIGRFCDRALVMARGSVLREIPASDAVGEHYRLANEQLLAPAASWRQTEDVASPADDHGLSRRIAIMAVEIPGTTGNRIKTGGTLTVRIRYHVRAQVHRPIFGVALRAAEGALVALTSSFGVTENALLGESGQLDLVLPALPLMPGNYVLGVHVSSDVGRLDERKHAAAFTVVTEDSVLLQRSANQGFLALQGEWKLRPRPSVQTHSA